MVAFNTDILLADDNSSEQNTLWGIVCTNFRKANRVMASMPLLSILLLLSLVARRSP